MRLQDQFTNGIDRMNKIAYSLINGNAKLWASIAEQKGIISVDEKIEIQNLVDLRNVIGHGGAGKVMITSDDVNTVTTYIRIMNNTAGKIQRYDQSHTPNYKPNKSKRNNIKQQPNHCFNPNIATNTSDILLLQRAEKIKNEYKKIHLVFPNSHERIEIFSNVGNKFESKQFIYNKGTIIKALAHVLDFQNISYNAYQWSLCAGNYTDIFGNYSRRSMGKNIGFLPNDTYIFQCSVPLAPVTENSVSASFLLDFNPIENQGYMKKVFYTFLLLHGKDVNNFRANTLIVRGIYRIIIDGNNFSTTLIAEGSAVPELKWDIDNSIKN